MADELDSDFPSPVTAPAPASEPSPPPPEETLPVYPKVPAPVVIASVAAAARSATVSTTPSAAFDLPPAVAEFVRVIDAARANSRFPLVRTSSTFDLVSWSHPVVSIALVSFLLSVLFATNVIGYTLPALVAELAVFAVVTSGGIAVYNSYSGAAPLPPLTLPVNAAAVERAGLQLGVAAVDAVTTLNRVLSWRDTAASVRGLAYTWLAARFSVLVAPGWLILEALLAFALAPLYLVNQEAADRAYATSLLPQARLAAARVESAKAAVVAALTAPTVAAAAVVATLGVYAFWDYFSFCALATLGATVVAAHDALIFVATPETARRVD